MRGQRLFWTFPRQDICIFCALRRGPNLPAARRLYGGQTRALHASPTANRPSAVAHAVAEDDSNDAPQAVARPAFHSRPAKTSWPTFVPKQPTPTAAEPGDRPPETTPHSTTWKCSGCGNSNLARRDLCSLCQRPKPASLEQSNRGLQQPGSGWGRLLDAKKPSDAASGERPWPRLGFSDVRRSAMASRYQDRRERFPPAASQDSPGVRFTPSGRHGHLEEIPSNRDSLRASAIPSKEQYQDSGDRSGMEALLDFTKSDEKPTSRMSYPHKRGSGEGETVRDQGPSEPQHGNTPRWTPTSPRFSESSDSRSSSSDNEVQEGSRPPGGDTETNNGERISRARGRFLSEMETEGSQSSPRRSRSRRERNSARRMPTQESQGTFGDLDEELLRERQKGKKKPKEKGRHPTLTRTPIQLAEFISVENLATALRVRTEDFIDRMEDMGFDRPRHDHILDAETSGLIASEFNFEPTYRHEAQLQDLVARPAAEDRSQLPSRPPIVTIMGHVDHGKTTILDWLRKSSVAASEHGGITQHIGAFSVAMPGGKQITFLDTPGHAAFLDMRRRGANVTDIVILVVAADDSVKPQTIEAIKHATDAKVPIIVAINKVDKEESDVNAVKQDLARHGITVEDYGGDVQAIPVSGKVGKGMAELEEATVTLSEVLDHRAEVDGPVEGWIIESKVTLAGRVATVLVRRGTLRPGDIIVAGPTWARIRSLRNDAGVVVNEAPPGTPVQIDGWRGDDPIAGQEVLQANDEEHAKDVVECRQERAEIARLAGDTVAINATRAEEAEARKQQLAWEAEQEWASRRRSRRPNDNVGWVEGKSSAGPKLVHLVVKADVSGSVEAVVNYISAIGNNEIAANVIRSGVGIINESDVQHLASSGEKGYLISFNQPVDGAVSRLAETAGLEILDHNIIYKLTDTVKTKLSAELPPLKTQRVVGEAEIGQIFEVSVKKQTWKVAGCRINNGLITRSKKIRVVRRGDTVYDGTLSSLKNVKKDVTEMRRGSECGMSFENWTDFESGDQVQCYEEQRTARTL